MDLKLLLVVAACIAYVSAESGEPFRQPSNFVNSKGEHALSKRSVQGRYDRVVIPVYPGVHDHPRDPNERHGLLEGIFMVPGDLHKALHDGIGDILNVVPDIPVISDVLKEYNDPTIHGGGHGHGR